MTAPYYSSGDTPLATSGDAAITILSLEAAGSVLHNFILTHTTVSVPFEISFDNGTTWLPMQSGPNGASVSLNDVIVTAANVKLRRIPSGTDVTGIYAWAIKASSATEY